MISLERPHATHPYPILLQPLFVRIVFLRHWNGLGETTLLRMLAGNLPVNEGKRVLGHKALIGDRLVVVGYRRRGRGRGHGQQRRDMIASYYQRKGVL